MQFHNTYLTIDLDNILNNYREISQKAGVKVMAVVKADAYGLGAVPIAKRLQEAGCAFFGVSCIQEALQLRQAGITAPILIFGRTPIGAFATAIREGIRITIFHHADALALSQEAQRQGVCTPFHFAVDTGMHRVGFSATEESADLCAKIASLPNLLAEGLYSHFATADCADLSEALAQQKRFDAFYDMLSARGVNIAIRHLDNSAGIMNFENRYEMVRAGIALYGMYPSNEVDQNTLKLSPALAWHSHIIHLQNLPESAPIGYGGTFVTKRKSVVATIPVGYADGYSRNLSSRFYVLIRGKKAPILGRVCMDQMMVDVTDIENVHLDESVTLIGSDAGEEIRVEQMAAQADSFNYELVCRLSKRICRSYFQNGALVETHNVLPDPQ